MLSIDIIFSETAGSLLNPQVFFTFKQAIALGMLIILYAGPPCETWSRARLRGDQDGEPRAVRNATSLAALPAFTQKEISQVCVGNSLLGVSLKLAIHMCIYGGLFVLEHPSTPPEDHAASIWRLPIVSLFKAFPQVQFVEILAGHFGAVSAKPTSFLVFNGPPHVRELMMSFRTHERVPVNTTIGRKSNGEWHTALRSMPLGFVQRWPRLLRSFCMTLLLKPPCFRFLPMYS